MTKVTISLPDEQANELKELTPGKGETSEFVSKAIADALALRRSEMFFADFFAQAGAPSAEDEAWIHEQLSRRRGEGPAAA
jgi:hypothetical protein